MTEEASLWHGVCVEVLQNSELGPSRHDVITTRTPCQSWLPCINIMSSNDLCVESLLKRSPSIYGRLSVRHQVRIASGAGQIVHYECVLNLWSTVNGLKAFNCCRLHDERGQCGCAVRVSCQHSGRKIYELGQHFLTCSRLRSSLVGRLRCCVHAKKSEATTPSKQIHVLIIVAAFQLFYSSRKKAAQALSISWGVRRILMRNCRGCQI